MSVMSAPGSRMLCFKSCTPSSCRCAQLHRPSKQRVKDEATTTWVKPKLVAEVKFTEWTSGGEMRHPAFVGLREDKKPKDVVLEREEHRSK